MKPRPSMQMFDWLNWIGIFVVGVLLGIAFNGLFGLATVGAWGSIIMILGLSAGGLVSFFLIERVINFISIGRFSEPQQLRKLRKPLALYFALPIGIIIGAIGAQFGLAELIL